MAADGQTAFEPILYRGPTGLAEVVLREVDVVATQRNHEVIEKVLNQLDGKEKKIACNYCQCRDYYVYCKRLAKRCKDELREGHVRGRDKDRVVRQWNEFDKTSKEFRSKMDSHGSCTCAIFRLTQLKEKHHGRRRKPERIRDDARSRRPGICGAGCY